MDRWLLKNGVILTLLSVVVAVSSALKEIIFAKFFGVSNIADAYTIAILLPETLFAVVWNAMNTILIPMYQDKLHNSGKKEATYFISIFFSTICIISVSFVLLSEIIADGWVYLFAPGFDAETHKLAVQLSHWTFLILIFEGVIRVCSDVMQVYKNFIVPKVLVMVRNFGMIIFLFLFASKFGVIAAVYGLLTGVAIESIIAFCTTRKYESISLRVNFRDPDIRKAGKLSVPILIGSGVNELNQVADKVVASFLVSGSMVALTYASKLEGIITTVILLNAVSLVFPTISEYVAKNMTDELIQIYERTVKIIIMLSVPIIVGGFILGKDIIVVAFMRGAFDAEAAAIVAPLFSVYLSASLFTTIRTTTVNVFAAYGKTHEIMINTIFAVIINIALNIVLSYFIGVVGLPIATCISSILATVRLTLVANKQLFSISFRSIANLSRKSIVAALAMGLVIYFVRYGLNNVFSSSQWATLLAIVICIVIGVIVYALMLMAQRTSELKALISIIKSRKESN